MVKTFLTILFLIWAALVPAQSVTLAWTGSTSAGVAGYRVYAGTNSGVFVFSVGVGLETNWVLSLPRNGRWYFTATAIDTNGIESKFSNEVAWELKPEPPVLHGETWVRLTPVIDCSTNLVDCASPNPNAKAPALWTHQPQTFLDQPQSLKHHRLHGKNRTARSG